MGAVGLVVGCGVGSGDGAGVGQVLQRLGEALGLAVGLAEGRLAVGAEEGVLSGKGSAVGETIKPGTTLLNSSDSTKNIRGGGRTRTRRLITHRI